MEDPRIDSSEADMADTSRLFLNFGKNQCKQIKKRCNELLHDKKVCDTVQWAFGYLMSNPILLIACSTVLIAFVVPLLIFTFFAIIVIAFTFTGFILVEGAILAVGIIVLCCVLFCTTTTAIVIGSCFVCLYCIFHHILMLIKDMKKA